MYVSVSNLEIRNSNLRKRLDTICKRTLRKQVTEYVRYTERHAILMEYEPTKDEEELYIAISDYLQTDKLYALPDGQRTLITMVLRKLLASSSFAIAGTLESLISRLRGLLAGVEAELNLDDYDSFDELADENSDDGEDTLTADLKRDHVGIQRELEQLERFLELAQSINANSKGDNLLSALEQGFQKMEELGGTAESCNIYRIQKNSILFVQSFVQSWI